jgi:hypothetical protein
VEGDRDGHVIPTYKIRVAISQVEQIGNVRTRPLDYISLVWSFVKDDNGRTYSREAVLEAWVMSTLEDRFAADKASEDAKATTASVDVNDESETLNPEEFVSDDVYPARRVE